MTSEEIRGKVEQALNVNYVHVEVQKYRIYDRGLFFSKNDSIYEDENFIFDVEFSDETIQHTMDNDLEKDDYEDEDDLRNAAYDLLRDSLPYWTVYFCPRIWDEEVALRVGLVPFYYDGEEYLALGGCGRDLSPKLDAYQALTDGTIDSPSRFEGCNKDFFTSVAGGPKIVESVIRAVSRDKPRIIISFDMEGVDGDR